jgi:2-oxoglutarate dehydrogenase E1 component
VVAKDALVCWEAQFGDFVNEAQVIIDQFIASGEDKWGQTSGLALLLPHGFEGQGPEHSSGRIERFLQLAAEDNIQVTVPTTPAQYFHLLRRQVHRNIRKPLVAFTPKSLLRLPAARSSAEEFVAGHFREVLPDEAADAGEARAIILCSGKVFYELVEHREAEGADHVAIVRLEQIYPFPVRQIIDMLQALPNVREVRWVQEEPENMGADFFVHKHLHEGLPEGLGLSHAARPESASPASGSATIHQRELQDLLRRVFEGLE